MNPRDVSPEEQRVGLCVSCRHHRRVEGRSEAVFFLCKRSTHDPRYPKYPRLPVLRCPGYEPGSTGAG